MGVKPYAKNCYSRSFQKSRTQLRLRDHPMNFISMPQDMAEEYEKLARRLSKNKSVLFREMFLDYRGGPWKSSFRSFKDTAQVWHAKRGSSQRLMWRSWFLKGANFEGCF